MRYYYTSPWYGLGLAERRLGSFLHKQNRSEYVLSSKVGHLLRRRVITTRRNTIRLPLRRTIFITITPVMASSVRSKTVCSGWVSMPWISSSFTICRRIIRGYRGRGKSNSRSLARAHFRL